MNVFFLCAADWCGSAYEATKAIRAYGEIDAKHATLWHHPFGYGSDIEFNVRPMLLDRVDPRTSPEYQQVIEAIEWADVVHLWNCESVDFPEFADVLGDKVRSVTFTGTAYRENHTSINRQMKKIGREVVTAHPTMRYPDEIDNTFIPHTIDVDQYRPRRIGKRIPGNVGCYWPNSKHPTTIHSDIAFVESVLPDGWRMVLKERTSHRVRMERLSRCWCYFEYMDANMGYFGRSPLEAAAFGVPTFSTVSAGAMAGADDLIGTPPQIINVDRTNVKSTLKCMSRLKANEYIDESKLIRQWAEEYFSYPVIGKLYTEFFRRVA